ncbi:MAG: amino acid adenylation domain-containing protein [Methanobrevibacter sp.]|jgi:amino acid adenylation domain-containing protein|nr:amino acid adenylation domain-containing protein [Candidatus Methanovirga procula]
MGSNKDNNAKSLILSLENEILGLVEDTIPHSSFSLDTNLMDVGLDSISLMDLSMKIYQKYSVDILENNSSLKDKLTINNIAKSIESKLDLVYDDSGFYPLKKNQLGVYFEQLKKETIEYNIPFMLKFRKNVDLENFVERLFTSYPYLKSTIENKNNKICLKKNIGSVEIGKLAIENDSLVDETVESLIKPYDVQEGSYLYRVYIIESDLSNFCFFDFNHLLFDGSSIIPFIETVNKILNDENVDVDEIAFYSNILEDKKLGSNDYLKEKNFYESLWDGVDSVSELYDSNYDGSVGGETHFHIDMESLDAFCGVNNVSVSNLLLSAYVFTISKFSLSDKVSLSLIVLGKTPRFSNSVGMFANTLPFAIIIDKNLLINDFIGIIQSITSKIVGGGGLYSVLDLKKDYGYQTPIAYNYRDSQLNFPKLNNDILDFMDLSKDNFNYSFDLILNIDKLENEYVLEFKYSNDYSDELINNFIRVYKLVLKEFLKNTNQKIDKLEYLDEKEKNSLLNDLNDTFIDNNPENKTVVDLFEEQVRLNGDGVALIYKDEELTYSELNTMVNRLANYLLDSYNCGGGFFVPLVLDRSPYMVVSILAVLKCGCAYVPIAPNSPRERIKHIIEDTNAELILTDDENYGFVNEIVSGSSLVDVEGLFRDGTLVGVLYSNLGVGIGLSDPVYVIYTSGSTGEPKGVVVEHGSVFNSLMWLKEEFCIDDSDVILQKTYYTFDVSVWELILPFIVGAIQVLSKEGGEKDPEYLIDLINKESVSVINFVPSMFLVFLQSLRLYNGVESKLKYLLPTLRYMFIAGEVLDMGTVNDAMDLLSENTRLFNIYGPTEGGLTCFDCDEVKNSFKIVPIGKPVFNTAFYILDDNQKLLPKGAIGELYLGGVGLAKEYLNNPKLTSEKFILNPYQTKEQEKLGFNNRLYKTGDLVRLNENDDLEYIGRRDFQVKIRGYRIELGEIENTLIKINKIKQAIVTINNNQLVAYYASDEKIDSKVIVNELEIYLPDYMVPHYYCYLDELPLNSSGKVDRNKLQNMEINKDENYQKPNTDLEKEIFDICTEILGYNNFGVTNSLFNIGFSSISLITLMNKILNDYQVSLDLRDLLKNNMNIQMVSKLIESTGIREYIKHKKRDYYPLTPQQYSFFDRIQKGQPSESFIFLSLHNLGNLDPYKLKKALIKTINLNPNFKTYFHHVNGVVYQKINDELEIKINIYHEKLTDLAFNIFPRVNFDLFEGPLFSFEIYEFNNQVTLLAGLHHIIFDAYTVTLLEKELMDIYNGNIVSKNIDYFDYAIDLKESENDVDTIATKYLKSNLENVPLFSYIPKISKKPPIKFGFECIEIVDDFNLIDDFCKTHNIGYNHIFLAATVLALNKFIKSNNILLETILHEHFDYKYNNVMGLFECDSIPLFFNLDYNMLIDDYLKEIFEKCNEIYNIPPSKVFYKFADMVDDFNPIKIRYDFIYMNNSKDAMNFLKKGEDFISNESLIRVIKSADEIFLLTCSFAVGSYSYSDFKNLLKKVRIFVKIIALSNSKTIGDVLGL